jgi:hypothetical protein
MYIVEFRNVIVFTGIYFFGAVVWFKLNYPATINLNIKVTISLLARYFQINEKQIQMSVFTRYVSGRKLIMNRIPSISRAKISIFHRIPVKGRVLIIASSTWLLSNYQVPGKNVLQPGTPRIYINQKQN